MNLPVFPSRPSCRTCARWEQAPVNPGVPTIQWGLPGPGHPVLVVVGVTPKFFDHQHNEPFRGKPGDLVRSVYLANLSNLCTIYLTLLVRCGPDLPAKAADFKSCFAHHLDDLHQILAAHPDDPVHILLLGAPATTHFHRHHLGIRLTQKDGFSQNGKQRIIQSRPVSVFSTFHPGDVLRSNSLIHPVEDHMTLLESHVKNERRAATDPDIQPPRSPHNLP
jgi:uracil-DNA glycosylase family 4